MHAFDRVCRAIAAGLLALAVLGVTVGAGPAFAQSKSGKAKAAATTLPEPLTHDSIRELVSRLSDEDVRKLLIDQLDRAAVPSKAKDMAMSGMVEHNAGMVRERLGELRDAFLALPATSAEVVAKLDEPDGPSILPLVGALVVGMLLIAWVVERIYDRALRNYRKRLVAVDAETFTARSFRLGVGLALDLVGILVFALAALGTFLALWQGHGLRRIAIVELLIAVVTVRVTWLFARFLLDGGVEKERLLPFADASRAALAPVCRAARRALGPGELSPRGLRRRRSEPGHARSPPHVHVARRPCHRSVDRVAGARADRGADSRRRDAQRRGRLARRPLARYRHGVLRGDRRRARLRYPLPAHPSRRGRAP